MTTEITTTLGTDIVAAIEAEIRRIEAAMVHLGTELRRHAAAYHAYTGGTFTDITTAPVEAPAPAATPRTTVPKVVGTIVDAPATETAAPALPKPQKPKSHRKIVTDDGLVTCPKCGLRLHPKGMGPHTRKHATEEGLADPQAKKTPSKEVRLRCADCDAHYAVHEMRDLARHTIAEHQRPITANERQPKAAA